MKSKSGFTLMELMTVMVIMFILMGMATVAMRGVVRGAGISGAVSNTKAVLTQARQHAIMNQRPTGVIFRKNVTKETCSMVVATQYGKAGDGSGSKLLMVTDGLPWTEKEMQGATVYNLETGDFGVIATSTSNSLDQASSFEISAGMSSAGKWGSGAGVGFAVGSERFLPSGIEFESVPDPILFSADGAANEDATIVLQEKYVKDPATTTLKVGKMTGWVK